MTIQPNTLEEHTDSHNLDLDDLNTFWPNIYLMDWHKHLCKYLNSFVYNFDDALSSSNTYKTDFLELWLHWAEVNMLVC